MPHPPGPTLPAGSKLPHILTSAVILAVPGVLAWGADLAWRAWLDPAAAREALSRAFALPQQLPALAGALAGGGGATGGGSSKAAKERESEREAQARAIAVLKAASSAEAERVAGSAAAAAAAASRPAKPLRPFVELAYGERGCWGWRARVLRHVPDCVECAKGRHRPYPPAQSTGAPLCSLPAALPPSYLPTCCPHAAPC